MGVGGWHSPHVLLCQLQRVPIVDTCALELTHKPFPTNYFRRRGRRDARCGGGGREGGSPPGPED